MSKFILDLYANLISTVAETPTVADMDFLDYFAHYVKDITLLLCNVSTCHKRIISENINLFRKLFIKWLSNKKPTVADTKTTPHGFFDPLKAYRLITLTARNKIL